LVSDGVDASWPLFRGVEASGDVSGTFVVVDGDVVESGVVNEVSTQEFVADFSEGHAFELGWDGSFPASDLVQVVGEFLVQGLVLAQDDGVHSSTNPVAQVSEVAFLVASDSLADFIEDFDVVDQETLANVVEERNGALERFNHLKEGLKINITSLAQLDCVRDDLSNLTDELDTTLDSSGVLGVDVTNSGGNVSNDVFRVSNARFDLFEGLSASDTGQKTFNKVQDFSLGVISDCGLSEEDGVHSLTNPETDLVVVVGIIGVNNLLDFIDNFDVVDQKALANVVKERFRGGEGLGQLDEVFNIRLSGIASLGSVGDDLRSFTQQEDTSLDSSRVLASDVTDSGEDISVEVLSISNAGLDFLEEFSSGDTVEETFNKVGNVTLDVLDGFGVSEDDGVHSLTDPVSELVPVFGFISIDGLADLLEDINVVDDEALSDVVKELDGALEALHQLDEVLELIFTSLACLSSVWDDLGSLTNELDALFNLSSILGLDVFDTGGEVGDDVLSIADALSDLIEEGSRANTVQETFSELEDVGLGVIDRSVEVVGSGIVHERRGFVDEINWVSVGELTKSSSDKHQKCDESDFS
jgi:hypothetical protein